MNSTTYWNEQLAELLDDWHWIRNLRHSDLSTEMVRRAETTYLLRLEYISRKVKESS